MLRPFSRFCVTIGAIPESIIKSLSYEQQLLRLIKFLKQTVIPAIDGNTTAIKEIEEWINTLDLQDEVNNKLDEMVESGELQEIISEYLNSTAIFGFDTVEDMKSATNLINGSYAKTLGFHSINDGGGATYKIRTITTQDIVDNASIIPLDETLVAELIIVDVINIKQFGAVENEDNTNIFNKIITYNRDKKYRIYIPKGTYYVSQILIDYENSVIFGDGKALTIIKSIDNNTEDSIIKVVNSANKRNEIFNIKIDGNKNNNINVIDGIKLTSDSEYFIGDDSYNKIHDIEITLCSGNGLTAESSYLRELRIDNVRCVYNNKNGFSFNGTTDSIINNCTSSSNDEYGYYIRSFNMRISNCKAHHNGKGSENSNDLDYTRVPLNEFEVTSDEEPLENKTYYTISDLGVVEKFTGNAFVTGTTYYELNKLYYKRYAGFYLETYRSNINNIESQDNFGDGLYVNGGRNNITNVVCDNNGIIIVNGIPVSYASQNLEQLYDGIHLYRTTDNNIIGSFTNSRNDSIGKSQRSGLYIDSTNYYDGKTNGQIICENQVSDVLTKNIGSNGVIKIDVNGKQYYEVCNNSDIQVYGGSVYSSGDIISSIKKYGDRTNLHLILNKPEGFIKDDTSSDSYIGKIPTKYRPKENINVIGMLSDNKGYTQNAYCTCTITPNGDIRIRNTGSTAYPDLIITAEY